MFSFIAILPMFWTISTALKPRPEVYAYPPLIIPQQPTLSNFFEVFNMKIRENMIVSTLNSLKVTLPAIAISLTVTILSGYSLSRGRGRFKASALFLIFFAQLIPAIVLSIPLYVMFANLGLIDNALSLIIAYQAFLIPLSTAFMKDYFDSIPIELEESAMVDGCSRFYAFIRISLPLAAPGIAAIAIFIFLHCWEEYLFASIFILSVNNRTVALQLGRFISEWAVDWGGIMAASIWMMLPVIIVYISMQKWFISGLTGGALKG
jgi:ABC-type glycerol-3-phosphate transport system permease component